MTDLSREFEQALLSLDRLQARKLVAHAAKQLIPLELVESVIVAALTRIGESW
ncbi:MAG: hypothetical protein K0B01_00165 [Syntrophobacterales bacterium]|nr:hypothetical protein [Syntrophobacterales bacterium]